MEVEIWKLRDLSSELKGRPTRVHCATIVEVYNGMMNLKLRNGNFARRVCPQYARRIPNKPCELPSFIKMNSDVEARFTLGDGNVIYELGQVLTFLGKEDLVLKLYHDQRKVIVPRKECRIPNNMPVLNNYKEIDRLKKYTVTVETVIPDKTTDLTPDSVASDDQEEQEEETEDDQLINSPQVHQETQTQKAETTLRLSEPDPEDHEKLLAISSLMNNYQQKMRALSSEVEMKLTELSSDYRILEAKVLEALGKDWPLGGGGTNTGALLKSSRNSLESSEERSFSASGTPNPTPPPTMGFPPTHHQQSLLPAGVFFPHHHHPQQPQFGSFPGFLPLAHLGGNNGSTTPYGRRQLGDKIFSVLSQKHASEDAMKMTEDLLSALT